MKVSIAYGIPDKQAWLQLELPEVSTVRDAIEQSGILAEFPGIDPERNKVGVYGRVASLDRKLNEGDRVEIYRPLIADPKQVKRKKSIKTASSKAMAIKTTKTG